MWEGVKGGEHGGILCTRAYGEMRPVEAIPGMEGERIRENGGGVRTLVDVTVCPSATII
jgi:hypothetical protein